jgi:hypothetical protein
VIPRRARRRRVPLALALVLAAAAPGCAADPAARPASPAAAYTRFADEQPEHGGLRSHEAVITRRDVIVYRLYDSGAPGNTGVARRMGAFWTDFTVSSEAQARDQLAVCKGWNDMAKLVSCTLPTGSTVVRGPGQDANCALLPGSGSTAYHPGGAPQLFISNPSVVLTDCTDTSTGW